MFAKFKYYLGAIKNIYIKKIVIPSYHKKRRILLSYKEKYGCSIFIETGTFMGDTVEVLRDDFDKLFSIELAEDLAFNAAKRFEHNSKIKIIHGNSGRVLFDIVPTLKDSTLFWLDGHYSGEFEVNGQWIRTALGDKETPILEELKAILVNGLGRNVILIDDARLFNGKGDYPSYRDLKKFLANLGIAPRQIFRKNDIIRIVPMT